MTRHATRQRTTRGPGKGIPNFTRIYGRPASCVSPRMGYAIWRSAGELADRWRSCAEAPGDMLEQLPPCARHADASWLDRFVHCFDSIRTRAQSGAGIFPGCIAEELALHYVINEAQVATIAGRFDVDPEYARLPLHDHDEDFVFVVDTLFEEDEVLALFEPFLSLGLLADMELGDLCGVPLNPPDWFVPFVGDVGDSTI